MPEGPEIRRAADELESVLKGQRIQKVEFGLHGLKKFRRNFIGQEVQAIETRGKALLTHFDNGWSIYSHNQLYGVWHIAKRGALPDTRRQLRLALHTDKSSAFLYSASDISVWRRDDLHKHPFLARIGPDILDASLSWRQVAQRLQSRQFAGRALSAIYLDQAFLAGLGNYLRSEILFCAALDPARKPKDLTRAELGKLARTTLELSQRSYRQKGVTLTRRQYNYLVGEGKPHARARFFVFGRAGQPCRLCKKKIKRLTANARRVYVCPKCQV